MELLRVRVWQILPVTTLGGGVWHLPKISAGTATPGKTNMSPENQCLEDVFLIRIVPF